ncbi:class I SAM-dependent methyltransferase [Candidatus Enterococcus clewellii]|uniref:Methyltransferase type 11 domain-containing protein n=1 Tax=Candidatus Enterococcus clewellii TaxID=1834193 RepID=A0AAQ3VYS0_9ENTE
MSKNYEVNYDLYADEYLKNRTINFQIYNLLSSLLNISKDNNILEYGCGTGNYLIELEKNYQCNFYGVDTSKKMLENAKKKKSCISFSHFKNYPLNYKDSFFNDIYCVDVIHHVTDLNAFFNEMHRISAPKCKLVICTESSVQLNKKYWLKYFPSISSIDQERFWAIDELIQSAENAGWRFLSENVYEQKLNEPIKKEFLAKVKSKSISVFAHLDKKEYQHGLDALFCDYNKGISIYKIDGYTLIQLEKEM